MSYEREKTDENINENMNFIISDFGPIEYANIDIAKINIVAGKNSTGKSTASKLLYCFLRANSSDRQNYAIESIRRRIFRLVDKLTDLPSFPEDFEIPPSFRFPGFIFEFPRDDFDVDEYIKDFLSLSDSVKKLKSKKSSMDFKTLSRYNAVFKEFETLENLIKIIDEDSESLFNSLMEKLIESEFSIENDEDDNGITSNIEDNEFAIDYLINLLNNNEKLKDFLSSDDLKRICDILGEDISETDLEKSKLSENSNRFALLAIDSDNTNYRVDFESFSYEYSNWLKINDVFYLDSFSLFDNHSMSPNEIEHVRQLRHILFGKKSKELFDKIVNEKIIDIEKKIQKIIKGNFTYSMNGLKFNYQKSNLEMKNTASGIKQIGIVQMLLASRKLAPNSFLIIDEPEVNLHPEWQVKFAEILVLLSKELNINIYINSHSPLFIEAIDAWTERYDMENDINYYLTDVSSPGKYTFKRIASYELYLLYNNLGNPYDTIEEIRRQTDLMEW